MYGTIAAATCTAAAAATTTTAITTYMYVHVVHCHVLNCLFVCLFVCFSGYSQIVSKCSSRAVDGCNTEEDGNPS